MKKVIALPLFLFASFAFAAGTPDVTGQWTVHNSISGTESDQECHFVQAENKITGSCKSEDKEVTIKGNVDGSKVTWQYDSEYNGTPLTLTYTATVTDTGKFAGIVEVAPFNVSGEFTATPSKSSEK